ncbi:MAG: dnaN [Candidatus Saccharibacteria bacterium]|nr:dnaN [Candidatus Saccharibacteria bacterium]
MELQVTQENFTRALSNVSRVATNKAQLPILENILLRTDNNRLLVAATNLEVASSNYVGAKVVREGSITIPARLITEFVSNLPKEQINLKVENDHLKITCGHYSSIINGMVADEFPELPVIDKKTSIKYIVTTEDFKKAVSQTMVTSSSDSTRPVLTGVYWHSFEGKLYLAATDGYRLSEKYLIDTKTELSAIIPASTLQEVLRTINDEVEEIELLFNDTQVHFKLNETEITSRLIDGIFPDYRQLIPKTSETEIILKKDDFVRITKIASLFARESGGSVTISAVSETKTLSIHSIASELGENTSEAEAETITQDGTVTLNSRYLNEALSVLDGDRVTFRFSGKLSPCVLTDGSKSANYKHIIMPLKS